MQVKARRTEAGLTLLEVMAATAVLLATVTAVTTVTVTAARAGGRAQHDAAGDAALLAEAARLRALPFCIPLPPEWPATRESSAPSAVGELFPHADPALNDETALFHASGAEAGAFETSVSVDGVEVRRTAWMVSCRASGWRSEPMPALNGWRAWRGVVLPGEALLVRLEVRSQGSPPDGGTGTRGLTFLLEGHRPESADPTALFDESSGMTP